MTKKSIVKLKNVQFGYSSQNIISIDKLNFYEGEVVAILGKSGIGKTTLLRIIARHVKIRHGKITLPNQKNISYSSQTDTLFEWLTVEDNIKFALKMNNWTTEKQNTRLEELLVLTDLQDKKMSYPNSLSGGMKQRLALARAISFNPNLTLLDEPFGSLDVVTRRKLEKSYKLMLQSLAETSVIFITHDIENALNLADRVIVLGGSPAKIIYDDAVNSDSKSDLLHQLITILE